jgi:hypothetical protein
MESITLTSAAITELLASSRTRGAVGEYLLKFAASDEMAEDIMTVTQFSRKNRDSLYNSVNQNIKKLRTEGKLEVALKLVKQNDSLFLVNIDKYTEALAADEAEAVDA